MMKNRDGKTILDYYRHLNENGQHACTQLMAMDQITEITEYERILLSELFSLLERYDDKERQLYNVERQNANLLREIQNRDKDDIWKL